MDLAGHQKLAEKLAPAAADPDDFPDAGRLVLAGSRRDRAELLSRPSEHVQNTVRESGGAQQVPPFRCVSP